MVQRLTCLSLTVALALLTGCGTTSTPVYIPNYCTIAARTHPIKLSRKDSADTVRQVVLSNMTYESVCKKGK